MLVDPLPFAPSSGDANLSNFYATDFAPGSSTRVQNPVTDVSFPGGISNTLRINHVKTKENPGISTTRTAIRLDAVHQGADGDGNAVFPPRTASCYLVCVNPDGEGVSGMSGMVKGFIASLFASGTEATYDTIKAALSTTYLDRILAGEA